MEKRKVNGFCIGTIATIAAVICRILFDGIFFKIYREKNCIEIFLVIVLMTSILLGVALISKIMPMTLKVVGAFFLGIGVGGATINAIVSICVVYNMRTSNINLCQLVCFVILFMLSCSIGSREVA